MFRNRDRGLSNTLHWFFEVWNKAYNGELPNCSEGKSNKIANTSNSAFRFPQNYSPYVTNMLTWTIVGIWDFHYVFDYFSKNRYGSVVLIYL